MIDRIVCLYSGQPAHFGRASRACGSALAAALLLAAPLLAEAPRPVRPELASSRQAACDLEQGWQDPPPIARTRCWWWWLNGNVTRETLTRDLEEMKAKGLGGANIIDAGGAEQRGNRQVPHGPDFATPEWRELFIHALAEADRLGLELGFNIQSGWNLGGPSVAPEESTKRVTWSETVISGGREVTVSLPAPAARDGFYRDVAVVAFPLAEPESASADFRVTASSSQENAPPDRTVDGDPGTFWVSTGAAAGGGPTPDRPEWLQLEFDRPVEADRVSVVSRPGYGPKQCRFEVAREGAEWAAIAQFTMEPEGGKTVEFPLTRGDRFRLVILGAFDPRFPEQPRNAQVAELALAGGDKLLTSGRQDATRIKDFEQKAYYRYPGQFTATEAWHLLDAGPVGKAACRSAEVIDLSDKMSAGGELRWSPPPGRWKVLRFGYTIAGSRVSTHSENGGGLAIDYLDRSAFEAYWNRIMQPILAEARPYVGRSLRYLHTDSWELGPVNWTARMPEEFQRLRGYAITPWLPALAGYAVEGQESSTQFLNDFRRTLADLIAEGKYRTFSEYAHQCGLGIHPESGGPHAAPIDSLQCLGRNDIPMGEFWARSPTHRVEDWQRYFVKQSASAAHIYGKRLMLAEAFTTIGPQWEECPRELKPVFDQAACEGLNLTMLHTFDCSPPEMGLPGQAYFAGTHINPNITWWNQAGAFIRYLNRCHFLLQQGLFVADVVYFYGENIPAFVRLKRDDPARVLPGYDYDAINAEAMLTRTAVKDGRIVLPDGMSYRLLALPPYDAISLPTLEQIARLAADGATVVGRRPERRFGRAGGVEADRRFEDLVNRLWGTTTADGDRPDFRGENRSGRLMRPAGRENGTVPLDPAQLGAARVIGSKSVREVLAECGVAPDFTYTGGHDDTFLDYIHRATDAAEIYFVANRNDRQESAECSFRVADRQPELWDPVSGEIRELVEVRREAGRTIIPLEFAPSGSFFVLFRQGGSPGVHPGARNFAQTKTLAVLAGPWEVAFDPKWGGPASVTFEQLQDWTTRAEEEIRYFSGTAVYRKRFDLPEAAPQAEHGPARLYLDLGEVRSLAEVTLNGRNLGTVWTSPFRADISGAVRPKGNDLQIKVVNLWPNRLIGDERLPAEKRRTRTNITKFTKDSPLLPSGLLGPVTIQVESAR